MIKAIAFDYGGVIEIKEGDLIRQITDYLEITKDDWHKVYFSLNHLSNVGKHTWQEVLELTAKKLGASNTQISHIQKLISENNETRRINLELIEIIKDLKNKNYRIGLLSNNSVTLKQRLIDQNIIDLFDEIIISAEVGFQKPQPEIFEILFKKLSVNSNEVIFIDDTKQSLFNADNIGYVPLLFINNKELKEELLKLL